MTDTNMTYEHFIYGPAEHALACGAADLAAAGYMVSVAPEFDSWREDRNPARAWQRIAYGSLDKAFTTAGRDDIDIARHTHDAHYSGGGCFLAPPNPHD
ncbi:hypothetical protein [Nocardia sp. NPDC051570]|uniref:hypothetical protein n=1 Tax=Nocardia sp. NPDC051570 TaxID=3364324 RepID=UPI00379814AC